MGHSFGHDVISDWGEKDPEDPVFGLYRNCGFFTHDEAAILHHCAFEIQPGEWVDIGSHTGWTSAHIALAGCDVVAVDSMYGNPEFLQRARDNIKCARLLNDVEFFIGTSADFFKRTDKKYSGVCIDGDHCEPWPLLDAQAALAHAKDDAVIVFHDFIGPPTWTGAKFLIEQGWKFRVYNTAHMLCVCWRGKFNPPGHNPDPSIDWVDIRKRLGDFPLHLETV